MNIAIDLRPLLTDRDTGVTVYTRELLHSILSSQGHHTFFLYINCFQSEQVQKIRGEFKGYKNIHIIHTKYPNKLLNISLGLFQYPKLDKVIYKQTGELVDLFFCPDPRPTPVSKRCKKITTFHDISYKKYAHAFSLKTRLWHTFLLRPKKEFQTSHTVVAVSHHTKKDVLDLYACDPNKIHVCHSGVSNRYKRITDANILESIRKKYELPQKFFLSLSTLEPRKNLKRLVEAFVNWKKKNPDSLYKLVVAGCRDDSVFVSKKITIPEEYKKEVVFTGYIDSNDKPALYSMAEALYFISLYEGFGFPIVEAMKCGTPVVTSNISSMPEVAGGAAILVDPLSLHEIEKSFNNVIRNFKKLQKNSILRTQNMHWEKSAHKMLNIFEKCDNC